MLNWSIKELHAHAIGDKNKSLAKIYVRASLLHWQVLGIQISASVITLLLIIYPPNKISEAKTNVTVLPYLFEEIVNSPSTALLWAFRVKFC